MQPLDDRRGRRLTLVAAAGLLVLRGWRPGRRCWSAVTMAAVAPVFCCTPVLLQMGLRQSSGAVAVHEQLDVPIELAGDVAAPRRVAVRRATTRNTGMERFYTLDGHRVRRAPTARRVTPPLPCSPSSATVATAWDTACRAPWLRPPAVRCLVCTLLLVPAALLFTGPFGCRLALGAALACNPVALRLRLVRQRRRAVRAGDRHLVRPGERGRYRSAGAALAVAVLFKQFALAAVPALLVLIAVRASRRHTLAAAGPRAPCLGRSVCRSWWPPQRTVWNDTVAYGTGSFHIASYGVWRGVLARLRHARQSRRRDYPALGLMLGGVGADRRVAALLQWRSRAAWGGSAPHSPSRCSCCCSCVRPRVQESKASTRSRA